MTSVAKLTVPDLHPFVFIDEMSKQFLVLDYHSFWDLSNLYNGI